MEETTHIGIRTTKEEKRQVKLILECLERETGHNYNYSYLVTHLLNTFKDNPLIDLNLKRIELLNKIELEEESIKTHENIKKQYENELKKVEEKINNFDFESIPQITEDQQLNKALNHVKILINDWNIETFEDINESVYNVCYSNFGVSVSKLKEEVKKNFDNLKK